MFTISTGKGRRFSKHHWQWLGPLFLAISPTTGYAAPVYRCDTPGGAVVFQDRACSPGQRQTIVRIHSATAYAPSPHYALSKTKHRRRHSTRRNRQMSKSLLSYECRASDGEVFYRHGGCPHSLPNPSNPHGRVSVSARRIARRQACEQIHRAGAIGRRGHEHDQIVSTYEHDLGNDPCD